MKSLKELPAFIVLMLVLFNSASPQGVVKTPLCYGEPIQLICNYPAGCSNPNATFHWENTSGSWTSSERDPVIQPGQTGYASDSFTLIVRYSPPPGGLYNGSVPVVVLPPLIAGVISASQIICSGDAPSWLLANSPTGGQSPYTYQWQFSLDNFTCVKPLSLISGVIFPESRVCLIALRIAL